MSTPCLEISCTLARGMARPSMQGRPRRQQLDNSQESSSIVPCQKVSEGHFPKGPYQITLDSLAIQFIKTLGETWTINSSKTVKPCGWPLSPFVAVPKYSVAVLKLESFSSVCCNLLETSVLAGRHHCGPKEGPDVLVRWRQKVSGAEWAVLPSVRMSPFVNSFRAAIGQISH